VLCIIKGIVSGARIDVANVTIRAKDSFPFVIRVRRGEVIPAGIEASNTSGMVYVGNNREVIKKTT
jgi:hypothetical protein